MGQNCVAGPIAGPCEWARPFVERQKCFLVLDDESPFVHTLQSLQVCKMTAPSAFNAIGSLSTAIFAPVQDSGLFTPTRCTVLPSAHVVPGSKHAQTSAWHVAIVVWWQLCHLQPFKCSTPGAPQDGNSARQPDSQKVRIAGLEFVIMIQCICTQTTQLGTWTTPCASCNVGSRDLYNGIPFNTLSLVWWNLAW